MQRGSAKPVGSPESPRVARESSQREASAGAQRKVQVLLVSPFSLSRHVLRLLLEVDGTIAVVGDAGSAQDALRLVKTLLPDVVVTETTDRGPRDLDALAAVSSACPSTRFLLIAKEFSQDHHLRALRAGISGYLPMSIEPKQLRQAVLAVHTGQTVVHDELGGVPAHLTTPQSTRRHPATLTPRELEVVRGLAEGLTDKQIAVRLSMAASTVKIHLRAVYQKLGIHNRAQAVVYAASNELLDGQFAGTAYRMAPTHS